VSARIAATVLLTACAVGAHAQTPYRVLDIRPGPAGSEPGALSRAGGVVVFTASDPEHGAELWRSDGTREGTYLLKDIVPGPESSSLSDLAEVGNLTYFRVSHWEYPRSFELWKTDGTEDGTLRVKAWPTEEGWPENLAGSGSTLYFRAQTLEAGSELWKSDGTEEGTVLVKDIVPGAGSSAPGALVGFSGGVFFSANTPGVGLEVWKSDGTAAGTTLVKDIQPGAAGSNATEPKVSWNGQVYFAATRTTSGRELWVSDGTDAGTRPVVDLVPGTGSSFPEHLGVRNGAVYFSAQGSSVGGFYRTDGTAAGTVRLLAGPAGGRTMAAGGLTYFTADGEPYVSDGTVAGTRLLRDIDPGMWGSTPIFFGDVGGSMYFWAQEPPTGFELWRSDGTEAGTSLVRDVWPGTESPFQYGSGIAAGDRLFFVTSDGVSGRELWTLQAGAPAVDAGPDQQVADGAVVSLDGSASFDPEGDPITFEWRDQNDTVLASNATFEIQLPIGVHELTLAVHDGVRTGYDTVVVRVGQALTLTVAGEPVGQGPWHQGTVTVEPGGSCALDGWDASHTCDYLYATDETVVLTATNGMGTTFAGWEGACSGTDPCTVTMTEPQAVTARFVGQRVLGVDVIGQENGLGSVRFDPPGILCAIPPFGTSNFCEQSYTQGEPVVLTALPEPGSIFVGWSDPNCPGTGPCTVSMDNHRLVRATFLGPRTLDLAVTATGEAGGAVRIDPPATLCPVTTPAVNHCVETYAPNTVVQLTALPGPGTTFDGWGPPCAGTAPCALTLTAVSTAVQASFSRANQPPSVALTSPAPGAVLPAPPASTTVTASASDSDGTVARVEFFVDGAKIGESTTAPYGAGWTPVGPGSYVLTARATDDDGAATDSAPVSVTVAAANQPPTLSVTSPLPGVVFTAPASVTLGADASDPDGTITRVEFFEGATSRGFDTTSPYSVTWSGAAAGSHALTAVATDNGGATTTVPFTVAVGASVGATADTFVRDGTHASTNYGGASTLDVRKVTTVGHNRRAFFKFAVDSVPTVTSARLRLFGRLTGSQSFPVQALVFAVADTSWGESTMTWNNQPPTAPTPLGGVVLHPSPSNEQWYEWDITPHVQAAKAAGQTAVTLAVEEDVYAQGAAFRARTAAVGLRPQLVLTP
jgi:ELWxxDGT repeat protein